MIKSFQKPANHLRELHSSHPGIIDSDNFNEHFELHCYEPSADLRPFLAHIWTQRQYKTSVPTHKPLEVASGPNMYLFFTSEAAFIHGITPSEFEYNPLTPGVIAGVKFRPGGLRPFLDQSVSTLATGTLSLSNVFPDANETFRKRLLSQPDEKIVLMLETLLHSKHPVSNKNLVLVAQIMDAFDKDSSLQTVGKVAQAFGVSERSLQLLFQTYVGTGLKWIIVRKRLLTAIQRVQDQDHPSWAKIAVELGYNSQSHFSTEFKNVIGQTPSQYLKTIR